MFVYMNVYIDYLVTTIIIMTYSCHSTHSLIYKYTYKYVSIDNT